MMQENFSDEREDVPVAKERPSAKDIAQQNALIEQYLPYATSVATKVARSISADADFDEILCNARLGLIEAAKRYDPRFNVDFKTFSYYRIRGAIYDGLRKTGWIPRALYNKIKMEQAANEQMMNGLGDARRNSAQTSENLGELYDTLQSVANLYVMSIDGEQEFELVDKNANKDIEHKAEFHKIKERMRDAIESLPDKERKLIKMYYFQNRTLSEIGKRLRLSKSWTSRLHARALEILFKKITNIVVNPTGSQQAVNG